MIAGLPNAEARQCGLRADTMRCERRAAGCPASRHPGPTRKPCGCQGRGDSLT